MLYIASALTPTAISHTLRVPQLTSPESTSLVFAKPDRVEVWDVTESGLVWRSELVMWGTIQGLEAVNVPGARPHFLVLVGPPNVQLHLVKFSPEGNLVITSSQELNPPTVTLRQQEFYTAVISRGLTAIASLWTGVLSCIEMELASNHDKNHSRSNKAAMDVDDTVDDTKIVFKEQFNINIKEHNLVHLAFGLGPDTSAGPLVTFLSLSPGNRLIFQPRALSLSGRTLIDLARGIDIVNPTDAPGFDDDSVNFQDIPFSCPAARRVLPVPFIGSGSEQLFLILGDEHSVLYSITGGVAASPRKATNRRVSNASNAHRSSQPEILGGIGKKRKASGAGKGAVGDVNEVFDIHPVWRVRQGFGTVLAATVLESHLDGGSVLISDENGRLMAIGWEFELGNINDPPNKHRPVNVQKAIMGSVSPPSALTYIDNGYVFVSSTCGDSLLVSLSLPSASQTMNPSGSPTSCSSRNHLRKGKGRAQQSVDASASWDIHVDEDEGEGSVEVKERWMNIAPVQDFAVVTDESGGVSHLVVASGVGASSSLRIVRSGVGLVNTLTIEGVTEIERIWSLSPAGYANGVLFISLVNSTAVLQLEPEVSQVQIANEMAAQPTLIAALVGSTMLLQVTPRAIQLWSGILGETLITSFETTSEVEFVAAQIKGDLVIAALRHGGIMAFKVTPTMLQPLLSITIATGEVSAIDILTHEGSTIVAISSWVNDIYLYTLDGLREGRILGTLTEAAYAVSLMFTSTAGEQQLLAGLSDGSFITYGLNLTSDAISLVTSRKTSSLGSRPLQLAPLSTDSHGTEKIIAAGLSDRFSVLFENRDHIEFSSSGKREVVAATAVRTLSLGSCLVLATSEGLTFERVTSLKKLQVQTLDLGSRMVNLITYVPELNVLALGTLTRILDPSSGDVLQSATFEIRDPITLSLLAEHELEVREVVASIAPAVLNGRQYIALGTAKFPNEEGFDDAAVGQGLYLSAESGRLILAEAARESHDNITKSWSLSIYASTLVNGPVVDVKTVVGYLAVASSSKVAIFRLDLPPVGGLREVSSYSHAFDAHYLYAGWTGAGNSGNLILGDGMRSLTILHVDEESGTIIPLHRDMTTHAVRAVEGVFDDGPGAIIVDHHADLFTFRLENGIQSGASFGLHEYVTRIRPGSLVPSTAAPEMLTPHVLFATFDGRLGIIGRLGSGAARTLDDLQRNMNKYHRGPGDIEWRTVRQTGNAFLLKDTAGFIDGDFVQQYQNVDDTLSETILHGSTSHEQVHVIRDGVRGPAQRADVLRILEAAAGMH